MNTTLNILRSPTATLETKRSLFDQLKRHYYNDEITYEQLEVYIELLYNTRHRKFGDLPATAPIKVPSLLEDLGVEPDLADSADLYIQLFDLYIDGVIGYDIFKNLFPLRHDTAVRIRAYRADLGAVVDRVLEKL
jgi:hypothetical protein